MDENEARLVGAGINFVFVLLFDSKLMLLIFYKFLGTIFNNLTSFVLNEKKETIVAITTFIEATFLPTEAERCNTLSSSFILRGALLKTYLQQAFCVSQKASLFGIGKKYPECLCSRHSASDTRRLKAAAHWA